MDEEKQLEKKQNNRQVSTIEVRGFQGPIPPPEVIEAYERIVPGSAKQIMKTWEKQVGHRIEKETRGSKSDALNSLLGVVSAFIIAMATVLGGVWVMLSGSVWAGGIFGGLGLVGLVSVFIYGTRSRSRRLEREDQRRQR